MNLYLEQGEISGLIRDQRHLHGLAQQLSRKDPMLLSIFRRLGPPPVWFRKPNFQTLIRIILEQQVSLASGNASWEKLRHACGGRVTAKRILTLEESGLRQQARLTRQKARYVSETAKAHSGRKLNFRSLRCLPDQAVRERLMQIPGIGRWTADVFLLSALRRGDILPVGDLALVVELARLESLPDRPAEKWLLQRAQRWRPWRAVATRMIWHHYLDRLGRHHEI